MADMDDPALIEFLRARIRDDEMLARAAFDNDYSDTKPDWSEIWSGTVDTGDEEIATGDAGLSRHIAQHDPARVLAEVDAKRRLMAIHRRRADVHGPMDYWWDDACDGCGYGGDCGDPVVEDLSECPVLRILALPYASHPDYRPEWASDL